MKWRCKENENGSKNEFYKKDDPFKLFKQALEYECAPEPSDVIWENLHIKPDEITAKKGCVFVAIVTFLILTFMITSLIMTDAGKINIRYPKQSCEPYNSMFSQNDAIDQRFYYHYAELDKFKTRKQEAGDGYY